MMWKIKACPKCKGDLFVDYDEDGMFNHCLQCGYIGSIDSSRVASDVQFVRNGQKITSKI